MPVLKRLRADEDVVNGLVVVQPRSNGTIDSYDGHAESIPSGQDPGHWSVLDGRFIVDPTGWSK
jgi:hypothetical protein